MKSIVSAAMLSALLVGCASNQLGDYAQFKEADGGAKSQLRISGRFYGESCSDHFAYLDFSVENPTASWQKLSNIQFSFPFGASDQFAIVEGEQLHSWNEAENLRRAQKEYNVGVGTLVVGIIGAGLMASANDDPESDSRKVGAALYSGAVISSASRDISARVNSQEVAQRRVANYFSNPDLEIPPGLSSKFWMVVSAERDAPLMGWLNASFKDNTGVTQTFSVPLDNWESCQWQEKRKAQLRKMGHKQRVHVSGSTQRKIADESYLMAAEKKYQAKLPAINALVD